MSFTDVLSTAWEERRVVRSTEWHGLHIKHPLKPSVLVIFQHTVLRGLLSHSAPVELSIHSKTSWREDIIYLQCLLLTICTRPWRINYFFYKFPPTKKIKIGPNSWAFAFQNNQVKESVWLVSPLSVTGLISSSTSDYEYFPMNPWSISRIVQKRKHFTCSWCKQQKQITITILLNHTINIHTFLGDLLRNILLVVTTVGHMIILLGVRGGGV